MNDLLLSGQLRALRVPSPDNGFEARLQRALAKEAQALRAPAVVVPFRSARRLQRWGARIGLGTALALGATAAAAAGGGIWALVVIRSEPTLPPPAAPALQQGAARRAQLPVQVSPGPAPLESAPPALTEPEASALSEVSAVPEVSPRRAVTPPAPVERKALRPEASGRAERAPRRQTLRQERAGLVGLVPFELPKPAEATSASAGANAVRQSTTGSGSGRATPTSAAERRALPNLPARAESSSGRPERVERDKKEKDKDKKEPPGREIARERAMDKAERGLERAKEARERNNGKK